MRKINREKRCQGRGNRVPRHRGWRVVRLLRSVGRLVGVTMGGRWPGRLERKRYQEMQRMLASWGEFQFILGSVGRSGVAESQQHPNWVLDESSSGHWKEKSKPRGWRRQ